MMIYVQHILLSNSAKEDLRTIYSITIKFLNFPVVEDMHSVLSLKLARMAKHYTTLHFITITVLCNMHCIMIMYSMLVT